MFKKLIQHLKNNNCYNKKTKQGLINKGVPCKGIKGGDRYSLYLRRECFNCTHYINPKILKN